MSNGQRILIVEDDVTTARVVASHLCQLYTVCIATCGLDALQLLEQQPDLLLLDLGLPDMSGLELLRRIKTQSAMGALPILVMSADGEPAKIAEVLAAGAMDYLVKPLSAEVLTGSVQRALDAPRRA